MNEVRLTRFIDAPRELVFAAWSQPEHLLLWYAPPGCTTPYYEVDFRVGGAYRYCISNPTYGECHCVGTYREIVDGERIAYSLALCDAAGIRREPAELGMDPEWPRETLVTVTFADQGSGTLITLHQTVAEEVARRTGALPSWFGMLDRLDTLVRATR